MTTAVRPQETAGGKRRSAGRGPNVSARARRLFAGTWQSLALDAAAAAAVLLVGTVQAIRPPSASDPFSTQGAPTWAVVTTLLCQSLPLLARRRVPIAVLTVLLAACIVQLSLSFTMRSDLGLVIALYSVCRYRGGRQIAWVSAATFAALLFAILRLPPLVHEPYLALFFIGCAMVAAIALGLAAKSRHAQLHVLADRAARLEIEREQREQLAAAAERARVSREMHDIVGHNLAVITGLADGAAQLAVKQPTNTAQTARAFALIAETSRQALSELRRTLGVMRDEDLLRPSLNPQPGFAEIPRLIERVQSAGPRVTYTTDGDLTDLAPGLQLTIYRIIQEALTNILKHAQGVTHVTVAVSRRAHDVAVTVRDDAPRYAAQDRGEDDGHGLLGLRERANLAGGTLTAGPAPERGWSVAATLPLDTTETETL